MDRWKEDFLIDKTFEVQLKTVLFQSWHEIEHDLRYKNRKLWDGFSDMDRKFNSILATLELCDDSIISVLENLTYLNYKKAQKLLTINSDKETEENSSQDNNEDDKNVWFLERIVQTHFRVKMESPEYVFRRYIDKDGSEYDAEFSEALKKYDSVVLFERYFKDNVRGLHDNEIGYLAELFSSIIFMKNIIKVKRNSFALHLIKYKNELPINVFTVCAIVYINDGLYSRNESISAYPDIEREHIKKCLCAFLNNANKKNVYDDTYNITKFNTYSTYQMSFDIYPGSCNNSEMTAYIVFKKVFRYVQGWLDSKVDLDAYDDDERADYDEFRRIFASTEVSREKKEFSLSSEYDIRAIYVPDIRAAAFKISEPGMNRKNIYNNKFDYTQFSRTFFTDISISECDGYVRLSVKVDCKEPERNVVKSRSFRPRFISDIYKDKTLDISEHGVDRRLKWRMRYNDNGKFFSIPYKIFSDKSVAIGCETIKNYLLNNNCLTNQLPIVFINTDEIQADKKEENRFTYNIPALTGHLMGYAYVVTYDNTVKASLSDCFKDDERFTDALDNYGIFVYLKGKSNVYEVVLYDFDKFTDYKDLSNSIENHVISRMVGRYYDFDDELFFRRLKNAYYELQAGELNEQQRLLITGLTKENEELKQKYEQALKTIRNLKG